MCALGKSPVSGCPSRVGSCFLPALGVLVGNTAEQRTSGGSTNVWYIIGDVLNAKQKKLIIDLRIDLVLNVLHKFDSFCNLIRLVLRIDVLTSKYLKSKKL